MITAGWRSPTGRFSLVLRPSCHLDVPPQRRRPPIFGLAPAVVARTIAMSGAKRPEHEFGEIAGVHRVVRADGDVRAPFQPGAAFGGELGPSRRAPGRLGAGSLATND